MPRVFESGFQPDGSYIPNPYFMERAFDLASQCIEAGDHPVGAVVAGLDRDFDPSGRSEVILGSGKNENLAANSLIGHAEITAQLEAVSKIGRKALKDCVLYTTHECCPMCAGAVANSKLAGVVYSTSVQDVQDLIQRRSDIKWRSNVVRMESVLRGRIEKGVSEQFIIGGFLKEQGLALLERTAELSAQAIESSGRQRPHLLK